MAWGETLGEFDVRPRAGKLSAAARAGLDVARATCAVYVVAHHVVAERDVPKTVALLFSFGQEAVLVFFLLSGFVIFANERTRVARPRGYYLRRIRRIYPPILFAMLISAAVWAIGFIKLDPTWWSAVVTLLSRQDISALKPGVISDPFLGNSPLWSLSYEVFFYLVFPLVMVFWRRAERLTRHGVGLLACLAYGTYLVAPNHLSLMVAYFLIWWVGAMAAWAYLQGKLTIRELAPELTWLAALIMVALVGIVLYGHVGSGFFPSLMARHFLAAIVLVALLLTPLRSYLAQVSLRMATPAALLASFSYGLYVLHYPLIVQSGAANSVWLLPMVILTVALAWVADRWLPGVLPKAPKT